MGTSVTVVAGLLVGTFNWLGLESRAYTVFPRLQQEFFLSCGNISEEERAQHERLAE